MSGKNNYINNNSIASCSRGHKTLAISIISTVAFILGIFSILVPGFGFYIGIAAISAALCDISKELFIFDRVKGIWLDLYAIAMGILGIMEMFF
jgi:uncharacterized membrane protein